MVGIDIITKLFSYNYWGNGHILECAARLTQEQLEAEGGEGLRSLRETLFHMLATEWMWRSLTQDHEVDVTAFPSREELQSVDKVDSRWQEEKKAMWAFLSILNDEKLATPVQIKNRKGDLKPMVPWQMLMHLYTHSMQHRTEAAALLSRYGQSPGDLDLIFFLAE